MITTVLGLIGGYVVVAWLRWKMGWK